MLSHRNQSCKSEYFPFVSCVSIQCMRFVYDVLSIRCCWVHHRVDTRDTKNAWVRHADAWTYAWTYACMCARASALAHAHAHALALLWMVHFMKSACGVRMEYVWLYHKHRQWSTYICTRTRVHTHTHTQAYVGTHTHAPIIYTHMLEHTHASARISASRCMSFNTTDKPTKSRKLCTDRCTDSTDRCTWKSKANPTKSRK